MAEFAEFFKFIAQPGMLPYSILLALALAYWLMVIIGFVGLDLLDFHVHVPDVGEAAGGAVDGAAHAAADGAAHAAGEGVGGAAEAAEGTFGALKAILGFLNFGKVPVTIVGSFIALKMWILAYCYYSLLAPRFQALAPWIPGIVLAGASLLLILLTSAFLTGLTTRPMRRIFAHRSTHGSEYLIGSTCKIKTSRVDATFGQAELKSDDSFLLISVRCDATSDLAKGDDALIIDYDQEKDIYTVSPV